MTLLIALFELIMTQLSKNTLNTTLSWINSSLTEPLAQARFSQGRVLALNNRFVHSYEISDQKQALYEDLFVSSNLIIERLHGWQASLYPTGYSGVKKIRVGSWHKDTISTESDFSQFLNWWSDPPVDLDHLVRAALVFYWFISLSPYEDGNYILACALAELALQENEKSTARLYDLALQLEENKDSILYEFTEIQKKSTDLTVWIIYFLKLHQQATDSAFVIAAQDRNEADFWKELSNFDLNKRQRLALKHIYDQKLKNITNREYVEITQSSRESAKRDLKDLVSKDILIQGPSFGRSVFYQLQK